jgi:tetratricopeptide (TPR) repeat protein
MPPEIVSSLISSLVGGLLVAIVTYFLTRRRTDAETKKLLAETEKTKIETQKLLAEFSELISPEVDESRPKSRRFSDYKSSFILFIIYKQLEQGRIEEVLSWFDEFKDVELSSNLELASVQANLARICGKGEAFARLASFKEEQLGFYEVAQYELALLKYAKSSSSDEILPQFKIENLSSNVRKLWASLLSVCYLQEQNMGQANYYFDVAQSAFKDDAFDAYCALHMGIAGIGLNRTDIAIKYFDIARKINREMHYPIQGYPYVSLVAKHNRAFVNTIIGIDKDKLRKEDIRLLRGQSHVIARDSHILRMSESAINTLVDISQNWKNPLESQTIKQRLLEFENHLLASAGTIFLGV